MRELRFAAGKAVAERKKAMKEFQEAEEFDGDPWEPFKSKKEPWTKMSIPVALKSKTFTEVAEKVLGEQHMENLKRLKDHSKEVRRASNQRANLHIRVANLTKKLNLTEGQQTKVIDLLTARAAKKRETAKKFKGREDEIPEPTPLHKDEAFLKLLDANQKKRLEKRPRRSVKPNRGTRASSVSKTAASRCQSGFSIRSECRKRPR